MRALYPKYLKAVPTIFGISIYEIILMGMAFNLLMAFGIKISATSLIISVLFILYKWLKSQVDIQSIYLKRFKLDEVDLSKLIKEEL